MDSFILDEVSAGDIEPSLNPSYYAKGFDNEQVLYQPKSGTLRERPNPFT